MLKGRAGIFLLGNALFSIAVFFFAIALLGEAKPEEAYIGSFDTIFFNDNWEISWNDRRQTTSLPTYLTDCKNTTVIMENTLPDTVRNGMRLAMRSALQEMRFYIDGELRGAYTTDNLPYVGTHLPSSYILIDLYDTDAGKPIRIQVTVGDRNTLNEIRIGYGNNVWFTPLSDNIAVVIAAIVLAAVGVFAIAFFFVLRKRLHLTPAICFLGQSMVVVGLWILSESHLRQLIFHTPSYTSIFAYLLLESLAGFVVMYFDEVQKRKYKRIYTIMAAIIFGQVSVNMLLAATGIVEFFYTLIFSHIWLIIGFFVCIFTVFLDIKTGRIHEYLITALGMLVFLLFCSLEMVEYYFNNFRILGKYLCIGLILLLVSTIIQAVREEFERIHTTAERERFQAELEQKVAEQTLELRTQQQKISSLFVETVTALSEAVDAKDHYTSGHSKRVAEYSRMIAEKMGKSAEEQEHIYRAGLLHDVGKIRIPGNIINKDERLTEEERNIIKLHPVTGFHILKGIAGNSEIAVAAKYHHERYDGTGYPNGLKGTNIPEIARILCVADSYDAMASNRSYRNALPQEVIRREFEKGRGTQFDPTIADIMLQMIAEDTQYKLKQPEEVKKNILILDNDESVHTSIVEIMKDESMYQLFSTFKASEAFDILEKQRIDLLLVDTPLPGTDILLLLKAVHEMYETPVIFMTKDRSKILSTEFEQLGGKDYITKPFLPMLLLEMIHTVTKKTAY